MYASALLLPVAAQAAEVLQQKTPQNFVKVFEQQDKQTGNTIKESIQEFVPKGESVQNWSRMITLQKFNTPIPPEKFAATMIAGWQRTCAKNEVSKLISETQNGYPTAQWTMLCGNNPETGKPEFASIKIILGKQNIYVAQHAYRAIPTKQQIDAAAAYLNSVKLCDTSDKAHSCKK